MTTSSTDEEPQNYYSKPTVFHQFLTAHPEASCCCFLFCNLFSLILVAILQLGLGVNVINGDKITKIGLEIPDDIHQMRANAYEAARQEADFGLSGVMCKRSEAKRAPLSLILDLGSTNALTQTGLARLANAEDNFISQTEWKDRCALMWSDYPTCETVNKANTANPSWHIPYNITDPNGCLLPNSPVTLFRKYGDPTFSNIQTTITAISQNSNDWPAFLSYVDKDFDLSTNVASSVVKSIVLYGTPFHNYTYYMDKLGLHDQDASHFEYYTEDFIDKELTNLNSYMVDNFGSTFDDLFNEGNTPSIAYNYVKYDPMQELVAQDLAKIVISICFVFCYMWFSLGSFFVTCCGMLQIFSSFFYTLLIYRFLWPSPDGYGYDYFTLFCGLAMFVILGIGVISFFSNLSSAFIGVQTFGLFAGLLVCTNFFQVCTFFPSAVLVYDKRVKHWRFCFGLFDFIPKLFQKKKGGGKTEESESAPTGLDTPLSEEVSPPEKTEYGLLEEAEEKQQFFRDVYAPFLDKFKVPVLAVFVVIWAVFLVGACLIQPTPLEIYTLFPPGSNFYSFTKLALKRFPGEANPLYVHLVFGLNTEDPVDYGDMKATDFVPAPPETSTTTVSGKCNFDRSFRMPTTEFQTQFLDLCDVVNTELSSKDSYLMRQGYGINPQLEGVENGVLSDTSQATGKAYGIQCLMQGFQKFQNVSKTASNVVLPDPEYSESIEYVFQGAPVDPTTGQTDWDYDTEENSDLSCKYCFDGFVVSTVQDENVLQDGVVSNTTKIAKNCNCMGVFPVPEHICFSEFNYLEDNNPFKCITSPMFSESLVQYVEIGGNQNWWNEYVYATKDETNKFERIAMTEITVQTTLDVFSTDAWAGMDMVNEWDKWADAYNEAGKDDPNFAKVMVYVGNAPKWRQTILLMPAATSGVLLSLFLSWIVLVIACEVRSDTVVSVAVSCQNYILASLAILTIGMITTIVFGFLTFAGWGLGILEGILVVLVIGFSVDYTVHLSDSYKASDEVTRFGKVKFALHSTGTSILSGAISTIGAAAIMLTANIAFFVKFGAFIFLTIVLSTLFSLGFYCALLLLCGPLGSQGRLINLYGGWLTSASAHMKAEKNAAAREKAAKEEMKSKA
ncbi:hypothetical protein TL16_g04782 [Triparma laevis f. inornata]|uniref:SSD domain-containing protein n=1 Tax=Triparma laevis f. inornata TaxID=1714386 RepID=A0A9W7E6Y8_9STRA|nr:hypothetical protein TL16_g04782 [Triparma laevis f. inornata]